MPPVHVRQKTAPIPFRMGSVRANQKHPGKGKSVMNLTLLNLQARQSDLAAQISSLRFRVWKGYAEQTEIKRLRELEAEFAANNAKLKRRKK